MVHMKSQIPCVCLIIHFLCRVNLVGQCYGVHLPFKPDFPWWPHRFTEPTPLGFSTVAGNNICFGTFTPRVNSCVTRLKLG